MGNVRHGSRRRLFEEPENRRSPSAGGQHHQRRSLSNGSPSPGDTVSCCPSRAISRSDFAICDTRCRTEVPTDKRPRVHRARGTRRPTPPTAPAPVEPRLINPTMIAIPDKLGTTRRVN